MPRLELSLTTDYIKHWDVSSGIREFVSNARDAEIEFSAPMKIDWYNDTLRIENVGCTLPREALLLGNSSKMNRSDMLGRFGEGLATGTLALLRSGHPIKIRSGSEMWEPIIERSDKFNADVLVFHIHENRKQENRVRVEVQNISKEMWEELKHRFLFLDNDQAAVNVTRIKTRSGSLLIDPKYSGQVFVKGIFVQKTDTAFGYDFSNCDLDRDRKMVDQYDMKSNCNQIWTEAVVQRPDLLELYFCLFDGQKSDVAHIDHWNAQYLPKEALDFFAVKFNARYGIDSIPVNSMEESKDIEHYGKRGIVVNKQMSAVLSRTLGDFATVKKSLAHATAKLWSWSELTQIERDNFEYAMSLITAADSTCVVSDVDVVDFRSPDLEGLYCSEGSRVQIRQNLLVDQDKTLRVLIHEFAHKTSSGADGDKSHVQAIETLWMKVFRASQS